MKKFERIFDALANIKFEYIDHVQEASKKLQDIPGQEVIDWISARLLDGYWDYTKIINGKGVQNLEKVFGAKFSIETLINSYFVADGHWYHPNRQMLERFAKLTGHSITADDVIKNLDINYLVGEYGPGLDVFIDFLKGNNGNIKVLIKRIASAIENDQVGHKGAEDIVFFLAPHIKHGEVDINKLFHCIDWYETEKAPYANTIFDFFHNFVPELMPLNRNPDK